MHYCLMVLTNDFPSDAVIEKALKPYNGEMWYKKYEKTKDDSSHPLFTWDWWEIGGRYNGKLKLKYDHNDTESEYRWMFMASEPRPGRLFRSCLLEELYEKKRPVFFEDEYYNSMGARDGYIYVDGGKIADMLNFREEYSRCYCAIDSDGTAYAREHWDGKNWIDDPMFDDKIKAVCENRTDGYVVFIDLHD